MTHWEFLAEPVDVVRWMLEIDELYAQARESRKQQPPSDGPGGLM